MNVEIPSLTLDQEKVSDRATLCSNTTRSPQTLSSARPAHASERLSHKEELAGIYVFAFIIAVGNPRWRWLLVYGTKHAAS